MICVFVIVIYRIKQAHCDQCDYCIDVQSWPSLVWSVWPLYCCTELTKLVQSVCWCTFRVNQARSQCDRNQSWAILKGCGPQLGAWTACGSSSSCTIQQSGKFRSISPWSIQESGQFMSCQSIQKSGQFKSLVSLTIRFNCTLTNFNMEELYGYPIAIFCKSDMRSPCLKSWLNMFTKNKWFNKSWEICSVLVMSL